MYSEGRLSTATDPLIHFFLKFSQYWFETLIRKNQQTEVINIFLDQNFRKLLTIEIALVGPIFGRKFYFKS